MPKKNIRPTDSFSPAKARGRPLAIALRGRFEAPGKLLRRIRHESQQVIDYVFKHASESPLARARLIGNAFPRTESTLGRESIIPYENDALLELRWTATTLRHCATELNRFLQMQDDFLTRLLRGEYGAARDVLDLITQALGWSLWSVHAYAHLLFLEGTPDECRSFIADLSAANSNGVPRAILSFFDDRIIDSAPDFNHNLAALESLLTDRPDLLTYLGLYFARPDWVASGEIASALHRDQSTSVIDRYHTFVTLLSFLTATDNTSLNDSAFTHIISSAADTFDDPRFRNISRLRGDDHVDNTSDTRHLLEIADIYTRGEYNAVLEQSGALLIERPAMFELYEFYCLSLLHLQRPYLAIAAPDSLLNRACRAVFNVLNASDDADADIQYILTLSNALDRTRIAEQLRSFARRQSARSHRCPIDSLEASCASAATPRLALVAKSLSENPRRS